MNLKFLLFLPLVALSYSSFSQEIKIYKTFGGYRFERDSMVISPKMVLNILEDNEEAYNEFKQAKLNYNVAGVLGFAGGLLIGLPLGTAIAGGDPEWGLAAGGVGLLLAAIPFNSAFKQHAVSALDLYNQNQSSSRKVKLNFYLAGVGGKIIIRF